MNARFLYDDRNTGAAEKSSAMFAVSLIDAIQDQTVSVSVAFVTDGDKDVTNEFYVTDDTRHQTISANQKLLYFQIAARDATTYRDFKDYNVVVKISVSAGADTADYIIGGLTIKVVKATTEDDFIIETRNTDTGEQKIVEGFKGDDYTSCTVFALPSGTTGISPNAFFKDGQSTIPEGMDYLMLDSTFGQSPTLQTIGNYAFTEAPFIGDCYIPSSVITIGEFAFENAHFDKNWYVAPFGPAHLQTIYKYAFKNCQFHGDIVLPERIAGATGEYVIKENAFQFCSFDGALEIPSNLNWLNRYAFSGCENIKQLIISQEESGTRLCFSIGCLQNCNLPGELIIPNRCESIDGGAFQNNNFTTISLPKNINYKNATTTFYNLQQLNKLDLSRIESKDDNLFKAKDDGLFNNVSPTVTVVLKSSLQQYEDSIRGNLIRIGLKQTNLEFTYVE